ncbi:reverse transcriptase domain-containing protein, partial [Tanacetum coccineum]
ANYVIREIHMGYYGMHIEARSMVANAIRQGYYWPTMHKDARNVTQKCDSCQVHAPVPKRPKILRPQSWPRGHSTNGEWTSLVPYLKPSES